MPVVLKKTKNFAVFNRTDILKKEFNKKELQIKFKKYLPNKNEIISISNIINSNKVNTRKLKFNDNKYSEKKCKEWINNVQQKMSPNTLKKFNALLQSNMTNKNIWDIYLKNKTLLSLKDKSETKLCKTKTKLVYELISKSLTAYSFNELTKIISNLSNTDLIQKIDTFVLETELHDNTNMNDENSKYIFHFTIQELYKRLLIKFKKLNKFNFKKYVQNMSRKELYYHLTYLMDYSEYNSDNVELHSILNNESRQRTIKLKHDFVYLLSLYNNSKKEFKKYIKQLDTNTIAYHLSCISIYDKSRTFRDEIIRELLIALKNLKTKQLLTQGWNIKEIGEKISISEYLVSLLENSITMNEDDFIKSLENIDIRTFLILYQQVNTGYFHNHWHHNTENFMKYFEIALRRKQKNNKANLFKNVKKELNKISLE